MAEAERGARLATDGLADLGRSSIDYVTLLLLEDVYSADDLVNRGNGQEVLGVAMALPDPTRPPACLVTLNTLPTGAPEGTMAVTAAHEMFHCLQGATCAGPTCDSDLDGAAWWIEGAAEAFAASVVPESAGFTDRSIDFDAVVSARLALTEMSHEAAHFFYWRMQTRGGRAALMPFRDEMADAEGATAQQAATRLHALSGVGCGGCLPGRHLGDDGRRPCGMDACAGHPRHLRSRGRASPESLRGDGVFGTSGFRVTSTEDSRGGCGTVTAW